MPYKEPCGFRQRINVCKFKEEDCVPEKCDMFNLEFTPKGIMERMKQEQAKVKDVTDKLNALRVARKTQEREFKALTAQLTDLCYGCAILSKAYLHLKRCGKK